MRYLVLPLTSPIPDQRDYDLTVAAVLRKLANYIHMTPLGHEWNVNALFQLVNGIAGGDPIPDEFVNPIISSDLDPDDSGILEFLLPHRERSNPANLVTSLERLVADDLPLELDVRNRLEALLAAEMTPRLWYRLTQEEETVLLNHRAFKDMPTGDVRFSPAADDEGRMDDDGAPPHRKGDGSTSQMLQDQLDRRPYDERGWKPD